MAVQHVVESAAGKSGFALSAPFYRRHEGAVIALLLLVTLSSWLGAQTVNSTLQGRVLDNTGAAIPGATVTAVNAATGLTRSVTATAVGDYQIPGLPAGDYTVNAEKQGFQKSAKKIHLDVGAAGNLDFCSRPRPGANAG